VSAIIRGMVQFPLGEALGPEVLARREKLPVKPDAVTLDGKYVRLLPLDLERDLEALHAVSNGAPVRLGEREVDPYDADELIWRYLFAGPFDAADGLRRFLQELIDTPNTLPLCVLDLTTGRQIGVAAYTNNYPEHLKIELGHIWYSPVAQRTNANLESTYLMLDHAFELGYRRVEWKCDALNRRSRHSALRMGFRFEGIQEAHFIIKGRNRDTAWFRILDREWPDARLRLESMLYA
jgi:RimJ/RimL family protein N-acetyltransferase